MRSKILASVLAPALFASSSGPLERDAFFHAMATNMAFRQEFFGYFPDAEQQRNSEIWLARDGHRLDPTTRGG